MPEELCFIAPLLLLVWCYAREKRREMFRKLAMREQIRKERFSC